MMVGNQRAVWLTLPAIGDEHVAFIAVTAGEQFHADVEAVMTRMRVNNDEFMFGATGPKGDKGDIGSPGAPGSQGATGATGASGVNGVDGFNGVDGVKGKDGATMVIQENLVGPKLIGNTIRTLHAPARKGMKLVSVSAKMRNKALLRHGKTVMVDLRGKVVGNYNVFVTAKYQTKAGKVKTIRTMRSLSVTRA